MPFSYLSGAQIYRHCWMTERQHRRSRQRSHAFLNGKKVLLPHVPSNPPGSGRAACPTPFSAVKKATSAWWLCRDHRAGKYRTLLQNHRKCSAQSLLTFRLVSLLRGIGGALVKARTEFGGFRFSVHPVEIASFLTSLPVASESMISRYRRLMERYREIDGEIFDVSGSMAYFNSFGTQTISLIDRAVLVLSYDGWVEEVAV